MVNLVAIGKNIVAGAKTGFSNPIRAVKAVGQAISRGQKVVSKGTTSFVMPVTTPMGGIGKAASGVKTAAQTVFRKLTTNPLAGQTLKSGALKLGAGTLGVLGSIKAFQTSRAIAKGQNPNLIPNIQEVGQAAAFAYNPLAAAGGLVTGLGEASGKKLYDFKNLVNVPQLPAYNPPQIPEINFPEFKYPAFNMPDINITMPEMPSVTAPNIQLPGFSISAGGGGGLDMAMLALLLGAGGGYLLGRKRKRKRKKKKYKKRRSR